VVLRNALERRRELRCWARRLRPAIEKLLRYEMLALLAAGLLSGVAAALLAVAPALKSRGMGLPAAGLLGMLVLILFCGWLAVGTIVGMIAAGYFVMMKIADIEV
jgi:hypothetical protein